MLEIPHLATDRLLLRGFLPADLEPYAEMMANLEVTRYLGWSARPMSRIDAWYQLAMFAGHWTLLGRIGCPEPESLGAVASETITFFDAPSVVYRHPSHDVEHMADASETTGVSQR